MQSLVVHAQNSTKECLVLAVAATIASKQDASVRHTVWETETKIPVFRPTIFVERQSIAVA